MDYHTILFGNKLSPDKGEQWGLIWQAVPDEALREQSAALARRISRGAER